MKGQRPAKLQGRSGSSEAGLDPRRAKDSGALMARQEEADRAAGAALRARRTALGMSQEELALRAELDQSLLSKIERLGPAVVSWGRFCRVAQALGVAVAVQLDELEP